MITTGSCQWLEHDLDRAVGLAVEHGVRRRSLGERQPRSGKFVDAERVIFGQERHDVGNPALYVGLPHSKLNLFVNNDIIAIGSAMTP